MSGLLARTRAITSWNTVLLVLAASIHLLGMEREDQSANGGTCLDARFIINAAVLSAARSTDRLGTT